uniref:DUF4352 domain-containing protein n=1 Tax=Thermofilum pendens TaxID=2269 RepID=A0A7C4FEU1_THEPE
MSGDCAAGNFHSSGRMRAVSPVVSIVVLFLVAVVMAVGIAFWLAGFTFLTGSAVERLEVRVLQVVPRAAGDEWDVTLQLNNLGTAAVTIDSVFINGVHYYECEGVFLSPQPSITLNPGERATLTLHVLRGARCGYSALGSGVAVEVRLHTSSGRDYSCIVNLP